MPAWPYRITSYNVCYTKLLRSLLERLRFDVVICDVRMPQLGGMGLFQQLEERYPTMASRMIFLTGGGEDPEVGPFLVTSGQPYA